MVSAKSEEKDTNNDETESYNEDVTKAFSTIDFGLGIGASYRLNMGLFFGARYTLGLSNINDFEGANFKNHNDVFQISAGYSF